MLRNGFSEYLSKIDEYKMSFGVTEACDVNQFLEIVKEQPEFNQFEYSFLTNLIADNATICDYLLL